MKKDGQLGSVAPGKLADLVLVSGDPTTRISDIRRTALIVKDGAVYYPSAISRALGIVPGD
jgi:imidazolonepropionase-like amidohydrolase